MRKLFALLAVALLVSTAVTAFAKVDPRNWHQNATVAPRMGDIPDDVPARAPDGFARTDTVNFGYFTTVSGTYYAIQGEDEMWTWDHGSSNIYEGWYMIDQGANPYTAWRHINAAAWAGHDNQVAAPILAGLGSAWCGLMEDEAVDLCWESGLGYGNKWCQLLTSGAVHYDGTGDVTLDFTYFNDSETNFDYNKVIAIVPGQDPLILNGDGFSSSIGPPPSGVPYNRVITEAELGGPRTATDIQIQFKFTSDGGWSDEDGAYVTDYGPASIDNVNITNNLVGGDVSYTFEADLEGWAPLACDTPGSFFRVVPVGDYAILDPCGCGLTGNIVNFHDGNREHPVGQLQGIYSPPARKSISAPYPTYNKIFADYDAYGEMPQANGVFVRPGWNYYPFVCPVSGVTQWSGRQGQGAWNYFGDTPACFRSRSVGTDWGVDPNCELVGFVYEIYSSCDAFNVANCSGVTNWTPGIDNLQLRMVGVPNAPVVSFEVGCRYQDNFNSGLNLNVLGTGNADVTYDLHRDPPPDLPDKLGDSLIAKGPVPTESSRYLTRLWLRVRREGPGQIHNARYRTWRTKVADGRNIVGETSPNKGRNFTFGWMDSVEVGTRISNGKFCSQFHETVIEGGLSSEDDFVAGQEQGEDNEIVWDNCMTPGTKLEYFVSANYINSISENYLLPDTSGQFYLEMEILPSFRNVGDGRYRFPCVLYVDGWNTGAQYYIENALNVVLNGANVGDPVPDPTTWDRYDYLDAASNWCAPMFRNTDGNSGGASAHFLGYRAMFVNTGSNPTGTMRDRDWAGFQTWLTDVQCFGGSQPRQGWHGSGDDITKLIDEDYPSFLTNLGAFFDCDRNWSLGCPTDFGETAAQNDTLYCTQLNPVGGGAWMPTVDLDVYGNWCPPQYAHDVLGANTGVGNKKYRRITDGIQSPGRYAQVTNDASGSASNYRTVLDGYSIHHVVKRDPANLGDPALECALDTTRVVEGSLDELRSALKWTLGLASDAALLAFGQALCIDPCLNVGGGTSDVPLAEGGLINRLYQNSPNPFNPRTEIRFSLAQTGPAKVFIYDVNGREVRTLANGVLKAGPHSVVWDGKDNAGHPVPSGVFWSQLSTGDFSSNKKMVILK